LIKFSTLKEVKKKKIEKAIGGGVKVRGVEEDGLNKRERERESVLIEIRKEKLKCGP
jgi:hypothetical protein